MWRRERHLASAFVAVGGYRFHYWYCAGPPRAGAVPVPIVMIHGYGGSGAYLLPTARHLAAYYPTYVLDLPGFGRSSGAGQSVAAPALAEALVEWLRAVGLTEALWVGNSYGCQILAHLAARHPTLVSGLVLTSPTLDPRTRPLAALMWRFLRDIPRERLTLMPVITWSFLRCGPWGLWRTLVAMRDDEIEHHLPAVRMPTVVVCGAHDPLAPPDWGARLAQLLPRGAFTLICDAPHALPYTRPRALAQIIRGFARSRLDAGRCAQGGTRRLCVMAAEREGKRGAI